jgi:hypothetical protein
MRKKSPVLAAALGFIFGPLGSFYIGWRYAIMALAVFSIFVVVLTATAFPIRSWVKFVILAVLAWKAFTICSTRNHLIETHDQHVGALNTFPIAAMAMSDLLVGIRLFLCGSHWPVRGRLSTEVPKIATLRPG